MSRARVGVSAVIFDASSNAEFKKEAIQYYKKICSTMCCWDETSVSKLILTNSEETQVTNYVCYDPSNTTYLEAVNAAPGDWLVDLQTAVDDLYNQYDENVYIKYQVIVLSDLTNPTKLESEEIDKAIKHIVHILNKIHGFVYFIGIDVTPNRLLRDRMRIDEWVQNVKERNVNYSIATRIVKKSYGALGDFDIGADLFFSYSEGEYEEPCNEPLTFGNELIFPTKITKLTDPTSIFTLETEGSLGEDHDVGQKADRAQAMIDKKLLTIPKNVKGDQDNPAIFKLLGFTDAKFIPNHHMIRDSAYVVTNDDPEVGVINYIIESAKKHNQYGVALNGHKNCMPKLYCLIPKTNPRYFLMVQLPYAEDFPAHCRKQKVETSKPSSSKGSKTVELSEADVYAYLDSISLEDKIETHPLN